MTHKSPAMLNLERVFEQNRQRPQKRDVTKMPEIPLVQTKTKPRLLLMGQRRFVVPSVAREEKSLLTWLRSGKSSIASVVFHKLPPSETLFLESTARIQKDQMR